MFYKVGLKKNLDKKVIRDFPDARQSDAQLVTKIRVGYVLEIFLPNSVLNSNKNMSKQVKWKQ